MNYAPVHEGVDKIILQIAAEISQKRRLRMETT